MKSMLSLVLALPLFGCQSMLSGDEVAATQDVPKAQPNVGDVMKKRQAEVNAKSAESRLEILKSQQAIEIATKQRELSFAERELGFAKSKLASYSAIELPNKLASARLDLQRTKDSAAEAEEELNQILIMYEGQNLDDKTKEFVVERGRRQAASRKQQIEIASKNLEVLENGDLPREKARLEMDVERKEGELEKLRAQVKSDELERAIKWMNAELEVAKAKAELEALGGAKP